VEGAWPRGRANGTGESMELSARSKMDAVRPNGWRLRDQLRQVRINQVRINQDRGNIESALTLIPLMLLFLTVSQVGLSVYSHATNDQSTQGAVAYSAMGLATNPGESNSPIWSKPPIALPLPGGGSVLVGEREAHIPSITPLLPGGDSFTSTGIAIQE
jgi:hypothetical protein